MTEVKIAGETVEIGSVHLRWPWPASGPKQITALKPFLETIGETAIMAGDFNSVPWSYSLGRFASYAVMRISAIPGGTWLFKPLPTEWAHWFGLPIDNVLSKDRVRIVDIQTRREVGSDHLPVLVRFTLEK